jgi:hypothetical protein
MLISQFTGRLAKVNRTDIMHHGHGDTHTGVIQFSSIQSVSDVHCQEVWSTGSVG